MDYSLTIFYDVCFDFLLMTVAGPCSGLPILPSFQSNAREDPLPDMQDSVGTYAGPRELPTQLKKHIHRPR